MYNKQSESTMKKQIRNLLLIPIVGISISCGPGEGKNMHTNCGELETFSVDRDFCNKMGLPEVEFSLQFPKNLRTDPPSEEYQNQHYNYFLKWNEDEIQTEAFSIGYSTTQRNTILKDQLTAQVLNQVQSMWKQAGFTLSNEFIGKESFDGKEYSMFRAEGKINNPEIELVGKYLIQCLVVEPEVDNKNGVFIMMLANEDSEISSFQDFSNKGCISAIWQNFKFSY